MQRSRDCQKRPGKEPSCWKVGILGIGRVHQEPVVRDGAVAASILPLSVVVDHRPIDGVYACKFLSRFMELVSRPLLLLMP
jgi:pyruvate dehydrogenase E2 component (dihydrolipoamide acetyltransferase)